MVCGSKLFLSLSWTLSNSSSAHLTFYISPFSNFAVPPPFLSLLFSPLPPSLLHAKHPFYLPFLLLFYFFFCRSFSLSLSVHVMPSYLPIVSSWWKEMKVNAEKCFASPPRGFRNCLLSLSPLSHFLDVLPLRMDPAIPSPSLPLSQSLSSFSLSSNSPLDPTITPTLPCPSLLDDRHPPRRYSPFERLPPELIELIAYSLCRSTNNNLGPPSGLVHLLLVSKRFERVLSFKRNKGFYAGLFKQRFDVESVERRWNIVNSLPLSLSLTL